MIVNSDKLIKIFNISKEYLEFYNKYNGHCESYFDYEDDDNIKNKLNKFKEELCKNEDIFIKNFKLKCDNETDLIKAKCLKEALNIRAKIFKYIITSDLMLYHYDEEYNKETTDPMEFVYEMKELINQYDFLINLYM